MKSTKTEYAIFAIDSERKATLVKRIKADSLKQANEKANESIDRKATKCEVLPVVNRTDADSLYTLARYALYRVEKWERRNFNFDKTASEVLSRDNAEQIAVLAILEAINANANATDFELYDSAFKAIANERKATERKGEVEYMPGWSSCNITERIIRATYPRLAKAIAKAVESAELTAEQYDAYSNIYGGGISIRDYAKKCGVTEHPIRKRLAKAGYKILTKAIEIDRTAFIEAGLTEAELSEAIKTLRARAGKETARAGKETARVKSAEYGYSFNTYRFIEEMRAFKA